MPQAAARAFSTNYWFRLTMINQFKKLFLQEDSHAHSKMSTNREVLFSLNFKALEIGQLWWKDNLWHFEYSEGFKNQSDVKPLVAFPSITKSYSSDFLWPSFSLRIPSLAQPAVKKIVEKEKINANDQGELLKRFGKTTIANPFILKSVHH